MDKSEQLQLDSFRFQKSSKKLRQAMFWKKVKIYLLISAVVLVILYIFLAVVRVPPRVSPKIKVRQRYIFVSARAQRERQKIPSLLRARTLAPSLSLPLSRVGSQTRSARDRTPGLVENRRAARRAHAATRILLSCAQVRADVRKVRQLEVRKVAAVISRTPHPLEQPAPVRTRAL